VTKRNLAKTLKPFIGADGRPYSVTLARCRQCRGGRWGPSGRHTPDRAEVWTCLDCARPSPETPPRRAADRDEYACPSCHDFYSWVKETRSTICFVVANGFEGGIDLEDVPKYGPLLTRQDVHELCTRVRELLRQRDELQEEVAHLRETLGMFAALRDLMHDDLPSLAHVASNGHIVHRSTAAAGEGAMTLQMMADNPNDCLDDGRHEGPDNEDFDRTAPDEDAGDVSSVETSAAAIPRADEPPDDSIPADTVEAGEEARAISTPAPPASILLPEPDAARFPRAKTEPGESAPSPAPRPASDNAMDPVEAASTAVPSPPVKAEGKAPLPGTLQARILDLITQSVRPKRPRQVQRELGLPRLPSAELSKLVSRGYLVRVREGCYGIPGRDYGGGIVAESDNA